MNKINPNIPPSNLNPSGAKPIPRDSDTESLEAFEAAVKNIDPSKNFDAVDKWADTLNPNDPKVQQLKSDVAHSRELEDRLVAGGGTSGDFDKNLDAVIKDAGTVRNDIEAINDTLPQDQRYDLGAASLDRSQF